MPISTGSKSMQGGNDHDPKFRALAISASPTLFAFGSEAPPLHCFRHGYGCTDLSFMGLLTEVLRKASGTTPERAKKVAEELNGVARRFGLHGYSGGGYGYGSSGTSDDGPVPRRLGGQMLQIFVANDLVDTYVYHSRPFGVPIETTGSVRRWLTKKRGDVAVDGQVRILFHPELFLDGRKGRLFHYSGDWEFFGGDVDMEGSRAAFVQELRKVMQPLLHKGNAALIRERLEG